MRINTAFLYPNASRYIGTSLGVASLTAIIENAGHDCSLFDTSFIDDDIVDIDFIKFLKQSIFDVLFVHCTSADWWLVKHLIDIAYKELGDNKPLIIIGGQHPSIVPELVLEEIGIDAVVIGEGELVMIDILNCIEQGMDITNVKNCGYKKGGLIIKNPVSDLIKNLDDLPFPKWDIFNEKHRRQYSVDGSQTEVKIVNIETSRGCPYSCGFCMNSHYKELYRGHGKYFREKSADRIVSEAIFAKNKLGINYIQFVDDNFLVFEKRLKELSVLYSENVKLPFSIQASADKINSTSISLLKNMGVDMIAIGVECGNEAYREKILGKKITDKQIIEAIRLLKDNKICAMAYYMVGLPFETENHIEETIVFNEYIQPDICIVSSFYPFPGTLLYADIADKGKLDVDVDFGSDFFLRTGSHFGSLSEDQFNKIKNRFTNSVTFFSPLQPRVKAF